MYLTNKKFSFNSELCLTTSFYSNMLMINTTYLLFLQSRTLPFDHHHKAYVCIEALLYPYCLGDKTSYQARLDDLCNTYQSVPSETVYGGEYVCVRVCVCVLCAFVSEIEWIH